MSDLAQMILLILLGLPTFALFIAMTFYPTDLLRWIQRKRYQYEVTFSLYMLTPTEKFIFNSILFLVISMTTIAITLYLPEHVATMFHRALYYVPGDEKEAVANAIQNSGNLAAAQGMPAGMNVM